MPGNVIEKATPPLNTRRPVLVFSSDGHTVLANATAATPNPQGGSIAHDAGGAPTGIFEDEAIALVADAVPAPTARDDVAGAQAALDAMRKQGVTTFFSALSGDAELAAFSSLQKSGGLSARAYFAPLIDADMARTPDKAVAWLQDLAKRYDQGEPAVAPAIAVRHAKLFMDGVAQADMIVLDRNVFTIDAEQIANTKVLRTIVGGKVVYQADGFK